MGFRVVLGRFICFQDILGIFGCVTRYSTGLQVFQVILRKLVYGVSGAYSGGLVRAAKKFKGVLRGFPKDFIGVTCNFKGLQMDFKGFQGVLMGISEGIKKINFRKLEGRFFRRVEEKFSGILKRLEKDFGGYSRHFNASQVTSGLQ